MTRERVQHDTERPIHLSLPDELMETEMRDLDNLSFSDYNLTRIVSMVIWSNSHSEHDLNGGIYGNHPSFCRAGTNP